MLNHLRVLVANADPGIRRLLRRHFDSLGCATMVTATGQETLSLIKRSPPDLVVASAGLSDMDGLSLTEALRAAIAAPVMMLLPEGGDVAISTVLDRGADDCIEEPFLLAEFSARARRLLLRGGAVYRSKTAIQGLGVLEIEPLDRSVRLGGASVALTRKEFGLLAVLAAAHGRVLSYDEILRKVWGSDYVGAIQNLRRVVSSLRHKIEPDPALPVYLTSVRGSGYRLASGTDVSASTSSLPDTSSAED